MCKEREREVVENNHPWVQAIMLFLPPGYSQTCIKRSPLEDRKGGLLRQVTSYDLKRGSNRMTVFMT